MRYFQSYRISRRSNFGSLYWNRSPSYHGWNLLRNVCRALMRRIWCHSSIATTLHPVGPAHPESHPFLVSCLIYLAESVKRINWRPDVDCLVRSRLHSKIYMPSCTGLRYCYRHYMSRFGLYYLTIYKACQKRSLVQTHICGDKDLSRYRIVTIGRQYWIESTTYCTSGKDTPG